MPPGAEDTPPPGEARPFLSDQSFAADPLLMPGTLRLPTRLIRWATLVASTTTRCVLVRKLSASLKPSIS